MRIPISTYVHYEDIPMEELAPGAWSHLVAGKEAVVSFLTIQAGTYFPVHQHVAEQIMVVVEGYIDQVIARKMYRVNAGDGHRHAVKHSARRQRSGPRTARSSTYSRRSVRT